MQTEIMNKSITRISGNTYDEERALYGLCDALVENCVFAGPRDGESALKEAANIKVTDCRFSLRYPFWHTKGFVLKNCRMDVLTRAPIWYSSDGRMEKCDIEGVKCLRECKHMELYGCRVSSTEFGWKCSDLMLEGCDITSEYFLLEAADCHIKELKLSGKYSFQYVRDAVIENSYLDTKDAFWHAENVTVRNCTVKGEYLGWYSRGLRLEGCHIIGTQPLCYCEGLTLVGCTMEGCDLAFEYSDVRAEIIGNIVSVKNPKSGSIVADGIGEIIREQSVMHTDCTVNLRD